MKLNTFITCRLLFLDKYAKHVDLIIDATDNFETRQLINDFAFKEKVPWIYGGVVQSTYIEAKIYSRRDTLFNCLMPQLPAINLTCDTVGVIQPCYDDYKFSIARCL